VNGSRSFAVTGAVGRWLKPVHWSIALTSQTFTVGRVLLAQIEIPRPCTVNGLAYIVGSVSAGNVIGGLIGPVSRTADTPLGGAVLAQSASTAQSAANNPQALTWTAVHVAAGVYYVALEGSDATGSYMRNGNQVQAPGLTFTYDRSGGYGALTNPTPAVTSTGSFIPGMLLRLA
jgi:hypothetical protein